ncbi:unnamed protein product [Linum trigynum]|uniref:Uncharacterized protein n=1 Tax=Linum trigynum TaxID=586398 RepID=A0AAV2G5J4_9ROSI
MQFQQQYAAHQAGYHQRMDVYDERLDQIQTQQGPVWRTPWEDSPLPPPPADGDDGADGDDAFMDDIDLDNLGDETVHLPVCFSLTGPLPVPQQFQSGNIVPLISPSAPLRAMSCLSVGGCFVSVEYIFGCLEPSPLSEYYDLRAPRQPMMRTETCSRIVVSECEIEYIAFRGCHHGEEMLGIERNNMRIFRLKLS